MQQLKVVMSARCLPLADASLASFVPLPRFPSSAVAAVAAHPGSSGYDWFEYLRALDRPTLVILAERNPLPVASTRGLVTLPTEGSADAGHLLSWRHKTYLAGL